MSADDLELARRFLDALESATKTGEREAVFPFLAPDVVWVRPGRTLNGIEEIRELLTWGTPRDKLDVEFEEPTMRDLGDGHVVLDVREVYRMRDTNDFAYARDRQIDLMICEGSITRYEMRMPD